MPPIAGQDTIKVKKMKRNNNIEPGLLDNNRAFRSPFFKRFQLRHAPQPLELADGIKKDYLFPTFYRDVTCSIAMFLCSYKQAAALMVSEDIKPIRMPGGRSLVVFSCYEYRKVLGIPGYNEIAMNIPVMVKPTVNVPVLPLIMPGFKNFGFYCFGMPVTSLENQIRGRKIWGLPKVVQDIAINSVDNHAVTEAFGSSGQPYLTLKVPQFGTLQHFDMSAYLYSELGQELKKGQTCFKGDFLVNKNMKALFKKGSQEPSNYLQIDASAPEAAVLRFLEIETDPFQLRYCPILESSFDLPEADYRPQVHLRPQGERVIQPL